MQTTQIPLDLTEYERRVLIDVLSDDMAEGTIECRNDDNIYIVLDLVERATESPTLENYLLLLFAVASPKKLSRCDECGELRYDEDTRDGDYGRFCQECAVINDLDDDPAYSFTYELEDW